MHLMRSLRLIPLATAVCVLVASSVLLVDAQQPAATKDKMTFDDHVGPLFRAKCGTCHNPDKKSGGLDLSTFSTTMQGGSSGASIEPGDSGSSYLYSLVTHDSDPKMPPNSPKMADDVLATIRNWIDSGALENKGSKALVSNRPKVNLAMGNVTVGRPSGPPPMPGKMDLEPLFKTARANAVTSLAASPWAPLVAVGGAKQVFLFNSDSWEPVGVLPFPEGIPHVLKFSRNGSLLLAGGGKGSLLGRVVVWNVLTGERVFEIGNEFDVVLAADISSNQAYVALGGPSRVVRVFSTETGEKLYEIKKHTDWITTLEFSPDSVLLATADRNGGMSVWEAPTGREYLTLAGHQLPVTDLSWRIDSNVLASCSEDSNLKLWEMENGNQVKSWGAGGGGTLSVEFFRDGKLASTARDKVARVWDQTGKQLQAFPAMADLALQVSFTHDAAQVVAGDWLGNVKAWTVADAKETGSFTANPPTLQERIAETTQRIAQKQAEEAATAKALADAQTNAKQTADRLAQMQKAQADAAAAIKTAQQQKATAEGQVNPTKAALETARKALAAKQDSIKALVESAKKLEQMAQEKKDDADLAKAAKDAQDRVTAAKEEVQAAAKVIETSQEAIKTNQTNLTAAVALLKTSTAQEAESKKAAEALVPQVKAANDSVAAAQTAAQAAVAAHRLAREQLERWNQAQAYHKQVVEKQAGAQANAQ